MLRIASSQLAADYAREFQQLFEGRFGTGKSIPQSQGDRDRPTDRDYQLIYLHKQR